MLCSQHPGPFFHWTTEIFGRPLSSLDQPECELRSFPCENMRLVPDYPGYRKPHHTRPFGHNKNVFTHTNRKPGEELYPLPLLLLGPDNASARPSPRFPRPIGKIPAVITRIQVTPNSVHFLTPSHQHLTASS